MADFDEEAEKDFMNNFNALKDEVDEQGIVTLHKAIPHQTQPEDLPKTVRDAIGALEGPAVEALNTLANTTSSHILLHEHGNSGGRIIAMGL